MEMTDNTKFWQDYGATGTLIPCRRDYKLKHLLLQIVWKASVKFNMQYPMTQLLYSRLYDSVSGRNAYISLPKDQKVHSCSVTKSCPTLCPVNCSTPGFPGLCHLPGVCSNSCPWSRRCHPTISSSVAPFSSDPQSCNST